MLRQLWEQCIIRRTWQSYREWANERKAYRDAVRRYEQHLEVEEILPGGHTYPQLLDDCATIVDYKRKQEARNANRRKQ